jgi:hypothetical protein
VTTFFLRRGRARPGLLVDAGIALDERHALVEPGMTGHEIEFARLSPPRNLRNVVPSHSAIILLITIPKAASAVRKARAGD